MGYFAVILLSSNLSRTRGQPAWRPPGGQPVIHRESRRQAGYPWRIAALTGTLLHQCLRSLVHAKEVRADNRAAAVVPVSGKGAERQAA